MTQGYRKKWDQEVQHYKESNPSKKGHLGYSVVLSKSPQIPRAPRIRSQKAGHAGDFQESLGRLMSLSKTVLISIEVTVLQGRVKGSDILHLQKIVIQS